MANVDKAFGLRPVGNVTGRVTGAQYGYQIADNQAGAIYQGDLVALSAGYIVKFVAADHATAIGVFNGCFYTDPTSGKPTYKNYYPGSVNITSGTIQADVIDDPNQLFVIQADDSVAQADIGQNAPVATGSTGSNVTGVSNMELDASAIAATSTLALKILGAYNSPDNALGSANVDVIVKINTHSLGSVGTAGE